MLVVADTADCPLLMDVTSDFVYCSLHGPEELYASGYDDALERWSSRVTAWARGREHKDVTRVVEKPDRKRAMRDVFVYFDNDKKVRAPYDARGLIKKIEHRRASRPPDGQPCQQHCF